MNLVTHWCKSFIFHIVTWLEVHRGIFNINLPRFFYSCRLKILCFHLKVSDLSVEDYITATASKHPIYMPHTAGRYQARRFRKAQCPIVERLTNSLMMHGRNNGKKLMAVRIVKHAMEIIHLLTDANPIQIIVDAVINRCIYLPSFIYTSLIITFC